MKISTLFAAGSAMLMSVSVMASAPVSLRLPGQKAAKENTVKVSRQSLKAAQAALWRHTTEKNYGWDGSQWQLEDTYTIAYDNAGNVSTEVAEDYDGNFTKTTFAYNENN